MWRGLLHLLHPCSEQNNYVALVAFFTLATNRVGLREPGLHHEATPLRLALRDRAYHFFTISWIKHPEPIKSKLSELRNFEISLSFHELRWTQMLSWVEKSATAILFVTTCTRSRYFVTASRRLCFVGSVTLIYFSSPTEFLLGFRVDPSRRKNGMLPEKNQPPSPFASADGLRKSLLHIPSPTPVLLDSHANYTRAESRLSHH